MPATPLRAIWLSNPTPRKPILLAGRLFLRRELRDERGQARKALADQSALPLAHELLGEVALAKGDSAGDRGIGGRAQDQSPEWRSL